MNATTLSAKGAATRARIIEGAAGLIREQGVAAVGLDDIRAATATSKSQLFHYFPGGRSDLLRAVAEHEAAQIINDQLPALADLSTWPAWREWQRLIVEKYDLQRDRCPLSALTAQLGKAEPSTRTIITDLYADWLRYLADGVRALQATGGASADLDPHAIAESILVAIQGGVTMMMATDDLRYLKTGLDVALERMKLPVQPRKQATGT
ncbi:MAG: TetR family transcriptional regulator [Pseudonocardiales bacterium]|nr:TetR family transcriptional regulator [Pseudonocardiales bacterium]